MGQQKSLGQKVSCRFAGHGHAQKVIVRIDTGRGKTIGTPLNESLGKHINNKFILRDTKSYVTMRIGDGVTKILQTTKKFVQI